MDYYNEIKRELINNEAYKKVKEYSVNRNGLETYYRVGKLLIDAQGGEKRAKYGDGLIKKYSKRLINEVGKKYDYKTLLRIRQFYLFSEKFATVSRLSWSHYVELLKFDDIIAKKDNKFVMEYCSDTLTLDYKYVTILSCSKEV